MDIVHKKSSQTNNYCPVCHRIRGQMRVTFTVKLKRHFLCIIITTESVSRLSGELSTLEGSKLCDLGVGIQWGKKFPGFGHKGTLGTLSILHNKT